MAWKRILTASVAIALAVALAACSASAMTYVDAGRTYDDAAIDDLLASVEPGDLGSESTARAPELRQRALTDLRRDGGGAAEAARLLTETFPASTAAVPYYVERARFRGEEVWVVIEAQGRANGLMDRRRMWVLERDGDVVLSRLR